MAKAQMYQIAWRWRDQEPESRSHFDDLKASNAEAAIRRLRKRLREEYDVKRGDTIIQEVYLI